MIWWVNGRVRGTIDCRDRGFTYGDGVFETMRVRRGNIRLLAYHLERLEHACRRLRIRPPAGARLRAELCRVAARRPEAVLKLILTRGIAERGYRPSGRERCTRVLSLHALPASPPAPCRPVRIRLCATRIGANPALAGLKTLNRLESVLARAEWTDSRIWEGLMCDTDDNIICGTMSNFFLRQGNALVTPVLDRCGIAGVMRRWVMENAAGVGLCVSEQRLRWQDLVGAAEAFMTNAVAGIVPVAVIQHGRTRLRLPEQGAALALNRRLEPS